MNNSVDCLRRSIRGRRRQLGLGVRYRAAMILVNKVTASDVYQRSQHIAFYLAHDGELSCHLLMKQAWKEGKDCYLPVLSSRHSSPSMLFALYRPGGGLIKNRYGILEPVSARKHDPETLDLVVMPLVAFDDMGNRIGMGGGYYDRSFAFKRSSMAGGRVRKEPFLLGVAYRLQKVKAISPQLWDVQPDQVLAV